MREISLPYGSTSVTFRFDEKQFRIISREYECPRALTDAQIGSMIDAPIESPPLEEIISPGQSALIVVSDATRATGSAQLVNLLVRRLINIGVPAPQLAIIFATGIHRPVTDEEKLELLTPFIVQRVRLIDHNASDLRSLVQIGRTEHGTPVAVNRALRDFDHVIITGAITFHYFAGFTGARKSICPGLASAETVQATHMLALDFEKGERRSGVGTGLLEGNAVHEECERLAAMIKPSFCVNTVVDERGRIVQVFPGHWRDAHLRGCREYLSTHSVEIPQRRELVIASCGGLPYDTNLIQAHKTLDMATYVCCEGGTIVLLAECGNGLGRPDFLKWFDEPDSGALAARLRQAYEVNGQTAWALLTKTERYRVILVSKLPPDAVRLMRMTPRHSLEEALAEVQPETEGFLMLRGAAWLPVVMH